MCDFPIFSLFLRFNPTGCRSGLPAAERFQLRPHDRLKELGKLQGVQKNRLKVVLLGLVHLHGHVLRHKVGLHGVFHKFLRENEKTTHRLGRWLKLPDLQKSDFISENHQIRLKIGQISAVISLSFYKL